MASSEWRMGTPNGLFAIRYWKDRRDETRGRRRRPRPIGRDAPCRASKGLKMLKTTRPSYWLELASIWDRLTFAWGRRRLGSGVATLAMTGNARGNGNSRSPWPSRRIEAFIQVA